MLHAPALRPPVTAMVRRFLAEQGVALRPWTGLDDTYAALYTLMYEKRDDNQFWKPLNGLLQRVVEDAAEGATASLPAAQAELLSRDDLGALVRDLRRAVSQGAPLGGASVLSRLGARLSASAFAAFVALGVAAGGCSDPDDAPFDDAPGTDTGDAGEGSEGTGDGDTGTGGEALCQGADYTRTCDAAVPDGLADVIEASCLDNADREIVCGCALDMSQGWREGLEALFRSGSAEDIAKALSELVECCEYDDVDWQHQAYSETVADALVDGSLCNASVAIYMAVPFFE